MYPAFKMFEWLFSTLRRAFFRCISKSADNVFKCLFTPRFGTCKLPFVIYIHQPKGAVLYDLIKNTAVWKYHPYYRYDDVFFWCTQSDPEYCFIWHSPCI
jgi:hypothetical protein